MSVDSKFDFSTAFLVASNILTIILAFLFNWGLLTVLWLYWLQGIIIGFFTLLKILFYKNSENPLAKFFYAGFFSFHYGFFHFVYGVFLATFSLGNFFFQESINMGEILLPGLVFFINHGYSFYSNYLQEPSDFKNYKHYKQIMFEPYYRIVPMHITIIAGGFISVSLPSASKITLFVFLLLKTIADVYMHMKEHGRI